MDDWDGFCADVTVYDKEPEEPIVIYDADGKPFIRKKIKMGFDLDLNSDSCHQTCLHSNENDF